MVYDEAQYVKMGYLTVTVRGAVEGDVVRVAGAGAGDGARKAGPPSRTLVATRDSGAARQTTNPSVYRQILSRVAFFSVFIIHPIP